MKDYVDLSFAKHKKVQFLKFRTMLDYDVECEIDEISFENQLKYQATLIQ